MNKTDTRNFVKKLNNSYLLLAICLIMLCIVMVSIVIGLLVKPFFLNMAYTTTVKYDTDFGYESITYAKLVFYKSGRYSVTLTTNYSKWSETNFGDYAFGKSTHRQDDYEKLHNVIWYDGEYYNSKVIDNPFKITYEGEEFTNVGGIIVVTLCSLIALTSIILSVLLIIKRNKGKEIFKGKQTLEERTEESDS